MDGEMVILGLSHVFPWLSSPHFKVRALLSAVDLHP